MEISTTEADYIAAIEATLHAIWINQLLQDASKQTTTPGRHYIETRSAVLIGENQTPKKKRIYIDIRHHYVQYHVTNHTTAIHRIPTAAMHGDTCIKPANPDHFEELQG